MQDYSEVLSNADVSAREKKQTTVTVSNCEVHRFCFVFVLFFKWSSFPWLASEQWIVGSIEFHGEVAN